MDITPPSGDFARSGLYDLGIGPELTATGGTAVRAACVLFSRYLMPLSLKVGEIGPRGGVIPVAGCIPLDGGSGLFNFGDNDFGVPPPRDVEDSSGAYDFGDCGMLGGTGIEAVPDDVDPDLRMLPMEDFTSMACSSDSTRR